MLAEYGTMSLKQVLAPAMEMARGHAIDASVANSLERNKRRLEQWPYSKAVFLPHAGEKREAPEPGEVFVQKDLLATLTRMVEAEQDALKHHKTRKEAIYAAMDRFYKGDIAQEFVRGCQEQGGLITMEDMAAWKPIEEEPLETNYKGVEVYKLRQWTQGPTLLQALNILENFDLKAMGYNSTNYINTVYQAMSLAFADRDFYYGDPYVSTGQPMKGLLSKEYAKQRAALIDPDHANPRVLPGDPYPFEGRTNPFADLLKQREKEFGMPMRGGGGAPSTGGAMNATSSIDSMAFDHAVAGGPVNEDLYHDRLWRGTTSIEAADKDGWVISVTPSGGWPPSVIAGHTGVGMSQRMQSFVLDSVLDPFNVVAPHKRPRVTLSPSLALKDGKPYLCFSVQGGDTQDQNLLQFLLNTVDFGMTVQEATEAPNINTDQLWLSLGGERMDDRRPRPSRILLNSETPPYVRAALQRMGYFATFGDRTSGPLNAIMLDQKHGTLWGGSSNYGLDYGIGW